MIEIVKPVVENALPKALEAYKKAYELDEKHSKDKDISAGIKAISEKLNQEAYNAYTLGDVKKAEEYFEAAYEAAAQKPYAQIDTNSLYNAAFTSWSTENFSKAKTMFDKCLGYGYYGDGGEVFAKLSDCVSHIDTTAAGKTAAKEYLEQGFQKFPTSESIVFGLINYYMTSGEGTDRLFELLQQAKKGIDKYREKIMLGYGESTDVATFKSMSDSIHITSMEDSLITRTVKIEHDGVYRFGVHAVSDANMFCIYIGSIGIDQVMDETAPEAVTDLVVKAANEGELKARISFKCPTKRVNGQALAAPAAARSAMAPWQSAPCCP